MIDKNMVIEGLQRHSGDFGGCWDAVDGEIKRVCPYYNEREEQNCYKRLFADAIALIKNNTKENDDL